MEAKRIGLGVFNLWLEIVSYWTNGHTLIYVKY